MKLKKFDKVELEYLDSISDTSGWCMLQRFPFKEHKSALRHVVIGYFIDEDKLSISLAQSRALDNYEKVCEVWTVPRGAVTKIRKLK